MVITLTSVPVVEAENLSIMDYCPNAQLNCVSEAGAAVVVAVVMLAVQQQVWVRGLLWCC